MMNEVDIKALADKREGNIQKLVSYLNAGKTAEEKIVARLIEQIKNAEDILIEGGFDIKERINNDGTFTKIEIPALNEVENKTEDTVASAPVEEVKEETKEEVKEEVKEETKTRARKNKPKKTLENKVEVDTTKFGVSIKEDLVEQIKILGEHSNNKKSNDVVVDLLGDLFDGKNFNVNFERKSKLKVTSFNLPTQMVDAIEKINLKTDIPKSEIFNRLIEEALKDYF